jgi:hypothetical protein
MAHLSPDAVPAANFTPQETQTLCLLRARYQLDQDLFAKREFARLHFMRWLYETGRLMEWSPLGESDPPPARR